LDDSKVVLGFGQVRLDRLRLGKLRLGQVRSG
jgi:hypothetical protein